MNFLSLLGTFNHGLVLIYGLFLSVSIVGGWETRRQKWIIIALCPLSLLVQGLCWLVWGVEMARQLYPLIVHLPLVLVLVFVLKKRLGVALVGVLTAYLCCQLPRWVNLALTALSDSPLAGEIGYTLSIVPIFFLLHRYFVQVAHDAMTYSPQTLFLFGSLPFVYYVFDYITVVYSNALYAGIPALTEFFPTALIIFYLVFLAAYHAETQKRTQAELQNSMLEIELKQSGSELENLRRIESQTAIYQHDMRHHLNAIDSLLSMEQPLQAQEYVRQVQANVEAVTPRHFCENEIVNLLCSSFSDRAVGMGIRLTVEAELPKALPFSDTEICALLSNGLENALHAAQSLAEPHNWVSLYCCILHSKLLIEIRNPYVGKIIFRDGLPISNHAGHGYGCRSISTITRHNRGHCSFDTEGGEFILRVALPVNPGSKP